MHDDKPLEIIDTHAHLDLEKFDKDRQNVLDRAREGVFPDIRGKTIESGPIRFVVRGMVLPGITATSSAAAATLAASYPDLYAGAGIHPNHLTEMTSGRLAVDRCPGLVDPPLWRSARRARPLLERFSARTSIRISFAAFPLAKERGPPIIIHCRDAEKELVRCMTAFRAWEAGEAPSDGPGFGPLAEPQVEKLLALPPLQGVVHSYSGGPSTASELLELGFYLGFTGNVTFTGNKFAPIGEAAKIVPQDRILLETDSPFLIPHPFRGKLERNEPIMSAWTARRRRNCARQTSRKSSRRQPNARRLFRLLISQHPHKIVGIPAARMDAAGRWFQRFQEGAPKAVSDDPEPPGRNLFSA